MGRLSVIDYAFLALETAESPKHVAGLLVVDMPEESNLTVVGVHCRPADDRHAGDHKRNKSTPAADANHGEVTPVRSK